MNLWDEIVDSYNKELESVRSNLSEGSASDYATYKELVGFHSGTRDNKFWNVIKYLSS